MQRPQGVYCRSDRQFQHGITAAAGGNVKAGRHLMKAKILILLFILSIGIFASFSLDAFFAAQGAGGAPAAASTISGKVYQFEKIADGVYYATSNGPMAAGGNHPIIINDRDVV